MNEQMVHAAYWGTAYELVERWLRYKVEQGCVRSEEWFRPHEFSATPAEMVPPGHAIRITIEFVRDEQVPQERNG